MVIEDLLERLTVSFAYFFLFLFLAQIRYLRYKHSGRFFWACPHVSVADSTIIFRLHKTRAVSVLNSFKNYPLLAVFAFSFNC